MPSYLDLALIVVVLVSALLSMLRGFTREVLAIASWGAAAAAAYWFYPMGEPYLVNYMPKPEFAKYASAAIIFLLTLIIVSIITVKVSDAILDSKVGALDRSLGFLFGAGRGLLLCVVAFLFFNWLVPDKAQPEWVRTAKTRPLLESTGKQLMALLPDNLDEKIEGLRKSKTTGDDQDGQPAEQPAKPAPSGQRS
ncbi:MAG: CvpA family protein [Beijerinckiaceae bacterium]